MKNNIKSIFVMVCICSAIALLLAVTNAITAPVIEMNQNAAANDALLQVMPEGTGFESVDLTDFELPATVTEVYKEASGGYVFKLTTAGYGSDMIIMCGVDANGAVTGAVCLSSNETLGKEKTYGENFTGKDFAGVEAVDTIAGATKTTEAYRSAVKDALNASVILGGGDVDIRTEAEILADNLSAALPEGNGSFTKVFLVEDVEGIDAVYVADNGEGYVCVAGDMYIGVDEQGVVLTENTENPDSVSAQIDKIKSTALEEIGLNNYPDLQKYVLSAEKTQTGNYVLETKGAGYGIKGGNDYHPASGEYIVVKVSMTPDGRILDCITVSQAETDGLGSACAEEDFYSQFSGKTQSDYTEIDGISGATMTTDGYKQAIQRAFDAVLVFEGGAE